MKEIVLIKKKRIKNLIVRLEQIGSVFVVSSGELRDDDSINVDWFVINNDKFFIENAFDERISLIKEGLKVVHCKECGGLIHFYNGEGYCNSCLKVVSHGNKS